MSLVRETVARMLVIFPFEQALYEAARVPVTFVGHPLLDLVRPEADRRAFLTDCGLHPERPLVAVLPGSRPQEVAHNLPALAAAVKTMAESRPDLQFALAGAPSLPPELFAPFRQPYLPVVFGRTHGLVGAAELALVASGTATVETAILGTPMIVVYRLSPLTYWLGRRFVKVDHFAMVNLIAGRPVVQELIQNDFTPARLAHEGLRLLGDPERLQRMRADLVEVKGRLGGGGASGRAAATVLQELALVRSDIDRREATV
jgi:lipid-A-disaccharide synthase